MVYNSTFDNSSAVLNLAGGAVKGTGTIIGQISNNSIFSPGLSPGILTILGDYINHTNSLIEIEISDATGGPGIGHDLLSITNTFFADGEINVTLTPGFYPVIGDSFTIVSYGARIGVLDSINLPPLQVGEWQVYYRSNSIVLQVVSPLPIEIFELSARKYDKEIGLLWQSNASSTCFTIEKSSNGCDFIAIGKVNSDTVENKASNYQFIDPRPDIGSNYYRLSCLDKTGIRRYSNIVSIRYLQDQIRVYPNPSKNNLIHLDLAQFECTEFCISDISGKLVYSNAIIRGTKKTTINLNGLPPGTYFMIFKSGEETQSRQLIIE